MMSYYANSATVFMHAATPTCWGDSSIAERAAILVFFPRGQPCLVCWLVSPPKWREAPSLLRSPFLVPLWVVSALALWDATPLGDVTTWRHALRGLAPHHH